MSFQFNLEQLVSFEQLDTNQLRIQTAENTIEVDDQMNILRSDVEDLDAFMKVYASFDAMVTSLIKYGPTEATLAIFNYNNELCDWLSIDELPTPEEWKEQGYTDVAMEGLGDMIKNAIKALMDFIKKILRGIGKLLGLVKDKSKRVEKREITNRKSIASLEEMKNRFARMVSTSEDPLDLVKDKTAPLPNRFLGFDITDVNTDINLLIAPSPFTVGSKEYTSIDDFSADMIESLTSFSHVLDRLSNMALPLDEIAEVEKIMAGPFATEGFTNAVNAMVRVSDELTSDTAPRRFGDVIIRSNETGPEKANELAGYFKGQMEIENETIVEVNKIIKGMEDGIKNIESWNFKHNNSKESKRIKRSIALMQSIIRYSQNLTKYEVAKINALWKGSLAISMYVETYIETAINAIEKRIAEVK